MPTRRRKTLAQRLHIATEQPYQRCLDQLDQLARDAKERTPNVAVDELLWGHVLEQELAAAACDAFTSAANPHGCTLNPHAPHGIGITGVTVASPDGHQLDISHMDGLPGYWWRNPDGTIHAMADFLHQGAPLTVAQLRNDMAAAAAQTGAVTYLIRRFITDPTRLEDGHSDPVLLATPVRS